MAASGQYATLEGISSYAYGLAAGLGNTEYSITAYPGICLFDKQCYGNLRGMFYQWFHTSDVGGRAIDIWGDKPEVWDFSKRPAADIVVINIGTNDANASNNVTTAGYVAQYKMLIQGVHTVWPKAQIILIVRSPIPPSRSYLTIESRSGTDSGLWGTPTSKVVHSSPRSMRSTSTSTHANIFGTTSSMTPNTMSPTNLTSHHHHSCNISTPLD